MAGKSEFIISFCEVTPCLGEERLFSQLSTDQWSPSAPCSRLGIRFLLDKKKGK